MRFSDLNAFSGSGSKTGFKKTFHYLKLIVAKLFFSGSLVEFELRYAIWFQRNSVIHFQLLEFFVSIFKLVERMSSILSAQK